MHIMANECLGLGIREVVKGDFLYLIRQRSDIIIKCLEGNPPVIDINQLNCYKSFYSAMPIFNLCSNDFIQFNLESFWYNNHADNVQQQFLINNVPVCPIWHDNISSYQEDYKDFKSKHIKCSILPIDVQIDNWLKINLILSTNFPQAKKIITFFDITRMPLNTRQEQFYKSKEEMIKTLSSLGWYIFSMPENSPPDEHNNNWVHYNKNYRLNFLKECAVKSGLKGVIN